MNPPQLIQNRTLLSNQQNQANQSKILQLRQWMKQKGCIIHPHIQIPSFVNGFQGVGTKALIPPKTVVIAVPSSLILTATKCYKDPQLRSIFTKSDDLFDYEGSDDAEFNILCVFLMYHKLNIETSPWKIYLQTIGEPQTAIDWTDRMLKGLNKSVIEEILHVRIECNKLRDELSSFLKNTKQFMKHSLEQIKQTFNYCYRTVMTRCFGYYFGQASLIPVADLINHGCEVVDHQLINIRYEKGVDFCESYKEKSDKIDCELMGIKRGKNIESPFRQRFLLANGLVQNNLDALAELNRKKIDLMIANFNKKLFEENQMLQITELDFCEEDDSEDNDTDADEQNQRQTELQKLQLEQLEQIENFKKYFNSVKVETYKQVKERFEKYENQLNAQNTEMKNQFSEKSRNDLVINWVKEDAISQFVEGQAKQVSKNDGHQETTEASQNMSQQKENQQEGNESLFFNKGKQIQKQYEKSQPHQKSSIQLPKSKSIVPIQMADSSESQSQDDEEWGLEPDSYFTLSTGSAVGANQQLYNSYGSRTNKFLLIWYGFCYRNNLYDSVSLRLHVQFHRQPPSAGLLLLDTYIGGQGLTFRKNDKEIVQGNEVSRQFRLKLNKLCMKLLTFLRLYLLDYYKNADLYKICVTVPSSIEYEIFVVNYYREIVQTLYSRYPLPIIKELKQQQQNPQTSNADKTKIRFKIIYLEEQRRILDENLDTINCVIKVWESIKKRNQTEQNQKVLNSTDFERSFYEDFTIYQLRKMQPYLISIKKNYAFIIFKQKPQNKQSLIDQNHIDQNHIDQNHSKQDEQNHIDQNQIKQNQQSRIDQNHSKKNQQSQIKQ